MKYKPVPTESWSPKQLDRLLSDLATAELKQLVAELELELEEERERPDRR